jgi:hypothetical protein
MEIDRLLMYTIRRDLRLIKANPEDFNHDSLSGRAWDDKTFELEGTLTNLYYDRK